jgi:hypothetical protein
VPVGTHAASEFGRRLDELIEHFRSEYDLTFVEAVGVLTLKATLLSVEYLDDEPPKSADPEDVEP